MPSCTFFGHHDCPTTIRSKLRETIVEQIIHYDVDRFYIGNQGSFDACAREVLREVKMSYPHIRYAVVLAYIPEKQHKGDDYADTILPDGIEETHPRYAIACRNDWMLRQADVVITYITHTWGGAYRCAQKATRTNKIVINIAEDHHTNPHI